jgi:peroxiredoxin
MRRFARALFVAMFLLTLCGVVSAQPKEIPADPLFKLQGLDGKVQDLRELRGRVVLVSFGATWCAPCSTELRTIEELAGEYRNQPVKFFWVSIKRPEEITNAALRRYARERKISFPVLRDTGKMVFLQFSSRVRLPMTLLLGRDGKVEAPVQFGMNSQADAYKADLRGRLNKLLESSPPVGGR